ncbi:MAG: glycosyltransferase [Sumerlaeia bacterium]
MKIVRVINELRHGGVQLRLARVAQDLVRRGHEVTVICTETEGPNADFLREQGVRVELVPVRHWRNREDIRAMAGLLREIGPDVVHSHLFRQNAPATVAARLAGVKAVFAQIHLVGTYRKASWVWADRILGQFRTGMLAVSEAVAMDIRHALWPLAPRRLIVLHNGVETEPFEALDPEDCRGWLRQEFGLPQDSLVLLHAARLSSEKNQHQLLSAFARLRQDYPQARLLMVGEGDLREDLEQKKDSLGLDGSVTFAGRRNDIPRIMGGSDVFVLPSRQEGFSNAILEAMAAGLPLVVSDVGGARECLRHERNGLILPPLDEGALTAALERICRRPDERTAMRSANRTDIAEFTQDRMVRRTLEIYEGALG